MRDAIPTISILIFPTDLRPEMVEEGRRFSFLERPGEMLRRGKRRG